MEVEGCRSSLAVTIRETQIVSNSANVEGDAYKNGGGVQIGGYSQTVVVAVISSSINDNFADDLGGGFHIFGTHVKVTIIDSKVYNNRAGVSSGAGDGAGVYFRSDLNQVPQYGTLTISGTQIYSNAATGLNGGGLMIYSGTVTISDAQIHSNNVTFCKETCGQETTCAGFPGGDNYASDGDCDDGGPGSTQSECAVSRNMEQMPSLLTND